MVGMLSQAQQGSGPGPSTPPAAAPGAGDTPRSGGAGPGQPPGEKPGFEQLKKEAIQLVYGERFDELIKMFEANGPENFAKSMAVAINTPITELEKKYGETNHMLAAKVGADLLTKLLTDIVGKKVLPGVTLEQVQQALPAAMQMYADSHPDVSQQDIQAALAAAAGRAGAAPEGPAQAPPPGGAEPPAPPLSTGPGPEPSGSPVPPGAV